MWFRNLVLFRIDDGARRTPEQIGEALAERAFRPCGGLEPASVGWAPPLGRAGSAFVHAAHGCMLVCARREERLLPPAVVREAVEERVALIEETEGRVVFAKERRRLRDDTIFQLLPRAFTRSVHTFAYLAPADGWLVVDAASERRAEELVGLLGESLAGVAIERFEALRPVATELTGWLEGEALPAGLALGDACELRDPADERAWLRCRGQDLAGAEIRAHLRAGMRAERVALGFEGRLSFELAADLCVKRLRFDGLEESDRVDEGDEAARLDADFALMVMELARLLERLRKTFA